MRTTRHRRFPGIPPPHGPGAGPARAHPALRRRLARLAGFAALALPAPLLHAHPIHTSVAEADYNRATGRLEVALRVFIDDFETAVSAHAGKRVSVAGTPRAEFDPLAQAYLAEKFTVRTAEGKLAAPRWLGRDVKAADNEVWFFFEVALPAGIEGCRLHHHALGEQFPNQINSVRVRDGPRKVTLVFLAKHTEKVVRFRP